LGRSESYDISLKEYQNDDTKDQGAQ
jgi:hypothetical protein